MPAFTQVAETPFAVAELTVNTSIPDANLDGLSHVIHVPGNTPIEKLEVALNIEHPAVQQLVIRLINPSGDSVILHSRTPSQQQPFTPVYSTFNQPVMPLAPLLEDNPQGAWTIQVFDQVSGLTGRLVSWGLRIHPYSVLVPDESPPKNIETDMFSFIFSASSAVEITSTHVADMNDDRLDELFLLSEPGNSVAIHYSDGLSRFDGSLQYDIDHPRRVRSADVNRDGRMDFVVASQQPGFPLTTITVFEGNQFGEFDKGFAASQIPTDLTTLALFDANGDDLLDIIVGGAPYILSGRGDGTFNEAFNLFERGRPGRDFLTYGDVNQDGLTDMLVTLARSTTSPNADPHLMFNTSDLDFPTRVLIDELKDLSGELEDAFMANIHVPGIPEYVVFYETGETDPTLWFATINSDALGTEETTVVQLAGDLLDEPIIPYDLNGDALDELLFTNDEGIIAFQKNDSPLGGSSTRIYPTTTPIHVQAGRYFSDGTIGMAVVHPDQSISLTRSNLGPIGDPNSTTTPTPTPTPYLFRPTPTPSPTPIPTSTPTSPPQPSPTPTPLPYNPDFNEDGVVDKEDLLLFLQFWHQRINQ